MTFFSLFTSKDKQTEYTNSDDKVYDEVNEDEYDNIRRKRMDQDDFVVDDDGLGYADYGQEEWDDNNNNSQDDSQDDETVKRKKKKSKTIKDMLKPIPKPKEQDQITTLKDTQVMDSILDSLYDDIPKSTSLNLLTKI